MQEHPSTIENILVSGGLWLAYILLFAAIGIIAYFSLRFTFSNKESNKKFLITAGLLLALFVISWLISPYDFKETQRAHGITPTNSGIVGGALIGTYVLLGLGVGVVAFFELKRLFEKN